MALRRKVLRRIVYFLKKGISPHKLALSVSLGITIGIIPLYGLTSIILTLIALVFRLNFTASQVAHYAVHPLQLLLIFPFINASFISIASTNDVWGTLHNFWLAYLTATVIWFVVSIPLSIIIYKVLYSSINRIRPIKVR